MESDRYIVLPNSADFDDTQSKLEYNTDSDSSDVLATINYTYNGVNVGNCNILYNSSQSSSFDFNSNGSLSQITTENVVGEMSTSIEKEETTTDITNVIFINVKTLIFIILLLSAVIIFILFIVSIIKSYNFSPRGQSNKRRREHKRELKEDKKEARKKIRRAKKQARQDAKIRRKKYK
jgi:hypothetical protein